MSIINGSLDLRKALLAASNLKGNPFSRTEPGEDIIDRVFVGRAEQLKDAAFRVLDRPRNLLVTGGYGLGKTTFIRKLLRELHSARTVRFLTGYAPLRSDSPQGLQLAALSALAEGALAKVPVGEPLHAFALEVKAELARLDTTSSEMLRAPDIRFREGLALANRSFDRVVIAIDEVDKRDAQTVQAILMGSRFFLDLEASFVLTGRYLDVFSDIRASLLAAFDHRIDLHLFTPEECEEIIHRNLETIRVQPEAPPTPLPFRKEVIDAITVRAKGLPRPLNLMAEISLDEAIWQALEQKLPKVEVTLPHLESALRKEGNLVFNEVGIEARQLLARIFQKRGYVSGAELDALSPVGGLPEAVRTLEELSRRDAVVRLAATEGPAFALTPTVDRTLELLQKEHERLQALWTEALNAKDVHTRGRTLEEFAGTFFSKSFKVVERNVRTDTEELDLLLERTSETDFRFKETYLFVECKNWRATSVGQAEVSKLLAKMQLHHRTQAFLLTTGDFSPEAKQQAAYALGQKLELLLIDQHHIAKFLPTLKPVGDFLVELHRKQTVQREYTV
jgi:Holliday junction resolvase-like predicted endonuclease